ncbi:hypothetical protein [Nocardia sp. NPDC019395]|uniref:hypothetical protein n=1 Tax=Nocardia sp. NPDC019395 TaxID=3154686 RepID=UPI0033C061D7
MRLNRDSVLDPIGHVLEIVRATGTSTVIVPDLAHVDNQPGPVCDTCDLITVCPGQLWMKTCSAAQIRFESTWLPENWQSEPSAQLRILEAHRIMQEHRSCNPLTCPRKAAAFTRLVDAGRLVPATRSPRERAAARGLLYPRAATTAYLEGPSIALLRRLLASLVQV